MLTWISHECTCVLRSRARSHLPPHPIPLGHPSALALSALFHALNLDRSSISHMVIYKFQCYSLKSSHPHLLPRSPKVCSLYLCLFCCLIYRVSYIGTWARAFFSPPQRLPLLWLPGITQLEWHLWEGRTVSAQQSKHSEKNWPTCISI